MPSVDGSPGGGCVNVGTHKRGGCGGCGGGVINWAYSVLWESKSPGVRDGSWTTSRDGGHGKRVGPDEWGSAIMIAEVSYARPWGLRERGGPRGLKGLRGVREGVRGTRVWWGWL